jgi:hypothetical protein
MLTNRVVFRVRAGGVRNTFCESHNQERQLTCILVVDLSS